MADLLRPELRSAALVDIDLKGRMAHGYAAVYDTPWSEQLVEKMGYIEEVARGAMRKALSRSKNIPALWQHERRDMLGTSANGTLRLKDDARGMPFELDLPDNALGEYVRSMVERGDVRGMSYGIETLPSDSTMEKRGQQWVRRVNNAQRIIDVSLTYEPSYEAATVELRSLGFAAPPLQELIDGNEAQVDDAVVEPTASIAMLDYRRRTAAIVQSVLEE